MGATALNRERFPAKQTSGSGRFASGADRVGMDTRRKSGLVVYASLVILMGVTLALGQVGLGAARIVFVLGCFGTALLAYRLGGLALHVQTAIVLFVFAPFLRRFVDMHLGFDTSGSMLLGPLLSLVATFGELRGLLDSRVRSTAFLPYIVILVCLTYGWALTAFQNDIVDACAMAAKYMIPLLYCVCLMLRPNQSSPVLESAARAFLVVSPIIGLYGIFQHLDPQPWDRLWMVASKMDSIGLPEPGKVRVFGTMNSPVSFAAYATCGLLLFSFTKRSFLPPILVPVAAILPLSLALLLSAVRTAWISAALSLVVCLLFRKTRGRAFTLVVCLALGVAVALLFTSFGDVVGNRLSSLDRNVSDDGSGAARIDDYMHVFGGDSDYLLGVGFGYHYDREMNALDGLLLSSAVQMGTFFGVIHTLAVLWAGVQAVWKVSRNSDTMRLVAASLVVGDVAIFLLTSISIGELGFLYWMLVGVLTSAPNEHSRDRTRSVLQARNAALAGSAGLRGNGRS